MIDCVIEMRELELVVALSEELHFRRAAERVHLSQPALTQALARLETGSARGSSSARAAVWS